MQKPQQPIEFKTYVSIYSSPIVWAWLAQIASPKKNSIVSLLTQGAETVLRMERLGIKFKTEDFNIDSSLFADPYDDPRIKSVRRYYSVNVTPEYFPLLYDYLSTAPQEHRSKLLLPLVEVFLVGFWGQAIGKAKRIDSPKLAHEQGSGVTSEASSAAGGVPTHAETSTPPAVPNEQMSDLDHNPGASNIDTSSTQQAAAMLSNQGAGSNLDSWA